jgi:hypothetical protein
VKITPAVESTQKRRTIIIATSILAGGNRYAGSIKPFVGLRTYPNYYFKRAITRFYTGVLLLGAA